MMEIAKTEFDTSVALSDTLIDNLTQKAIALDCVDLCINVGKPVFIQKGGKIIEISKGNLSLNSAEQFCLRFLKGKESLLANAKKAEPVFSQYRFINPNDAKDIRVFRVCIMTQHTLEHGKSLTMTSRLEPVAPKSGRELGIEGELVDAVMNNFTGVGLFVGGTGQGKTVSLAGIVVDIITTKNANKKIMVFSDPIEIYYDAIDSDPTCSVTNHEVGPVSADGDVTTFEQGIYAALRFHPNICIQGEVRDKSAILSAIQFANTGHFLLATLHANTCASAVSRIYNQIDGEDKFSVFMSFLAQLKFVVAQRLLTSKSGDLFSVREILFLNDEELKKSLQKCSSASEIEQLITNYMDARKTTLGHKLKSLLDAGEITPDEFRRNIGDCNL